MGLRRRGDRRGAHGSRRLLRPQRRRRRGRRRGAAVARGRRAGAGAAHARAGERLGAQGRRAADAGGRRARRADGGVAAYDFETSYPSNGAPTLALLLTRTIEPVAQAFEMGDRTARPPYAYDNLRVKVNDMAPIVRASWLRGVSALPNSFAHESYVDELATRGRRRPGRSSACGTCAIRARPSWCARPRRRPAGACAPGRRSRRTAGWAPAAMCCSARASPTPATSTASGPASARPGPPGWPTSRSTASTGEVHVRRVVVGHDAGLMVNPAGRRAPDPRQRDPDHQPRAEGAGAVRAAGAGRGARNRCPACCRPAWSRAANGAATRSSTSARCR